jgi:hypothetical protein
MLVLHREATKKRTLEKRAQVSTFLRGDFARARFKVIAIS